MPTTKVRTTLDHSGYGIEPQSDAGITPFPETDCLIADAAMSDQEEQRLAELRSFRILDSSPEACFDELSTIAASVCRTPIALVSLVDRNRQWSKAQYGLSWLGADSMSRAASFCSHAIQSREALVVEDAALDARFRDNPLVTGPPHIRFYAGAPLITSEGFAIGTICTMDTVPREVTAAAVQLLTRLARVCVDLLERRRREHEHARATRTRSELLDALGREMRGPVHGVMGAARLLGEESLNDHQRRLVNSMLRSGEKLLSLTTNVHEYAQVEADRVELQSVAFDLKKLLTDSVTAVASQARRKNLELAVRWHSQRTSWRVGDPERLQHVFVNLLSNAVKFTHAGSISIEVADSLSPTGVAVTVADTGIGIKTECIDSIFDSFRKPAEPSAFLHEGAGIGLALSKQLVTLMRGSITVESSPGVGSRFTVHVPLAMKATPAAETSSNSPFDFSGRTILVAEDDPVSALVVEHLLKRRGAVVDVVDNGRKAIEACHEHVYDAVLMDCVMPEIDGYEATRSLRSHGPSWCAGVPIIALTAKALDRDRRRSLAAGMSDHLTKPVRPEALEIVLHRALLQTLPVLKRARTV